VIHTKPRMEDRADYNLKAWGVQTLYPRIRETRFGLGGKQSSLVKPLFPGYFFARFSLNDLLHKIRYTRGVQSVVTLGARPVPVDDRIIDVIVSRTGKEGFVKLADELMPGDRVMIKGGPFKSLTGIFERRTHDEERVRILLDTLGYQSHVEIDETLVAKRDAASPFGAL